MKLNLLFIAMLLFSKISVAQLSCSFLVSSSPLDHYSYFSRELNVLFTDFREAEDGEWLLGLKQATSPWRTLMGHKDLDLRIYVKGDRVRRLELRPLTPQALKKVLSVKAVNFYFERDSENKVFTANFNLSATKKDVAVLLNDILE